jgi:hypothetical protein
MPVGRVLLVVLTLDGTDRGGGTDAGAGSVGRREPWGGGNGTGGGKQWDTAAETHAFRHASPEPNTVRKRLTVDG